MLDDVRVLEVSAPETMLAGRILADLGADVVVVEPPAGSPGSATRAVPRRQSRNRAEPHLARAELQQTRNHA